MNIERKLYTEDQVYQLILSSVTKLHTSIFERNTVINTDKSIIVEQWSKELLLLVEQAVAEEVVRRHVQGVTFSVWAGPPGSGKGTNIKVISILGKLYAEYVSQGHEAQFDEPLHQQLLNYSLLQGIVLTGTGGMFNKPVGEYRELFAKLDDISADFVAHGGFAGDNIVSPLVQLMVLYRLVQQNHKIQIDLWPRTVPQFQAYRHLVEVIRERGGNVYEEFVNIRVLPGDLVDDVRKSPQEFLAESLRIGSVIRTFVESKEYVSAVKSSKDINKPTERYSLEYQGLRKLLVVLEDSIEGGVSKTIIIELNAICERMAFRFNKKLEKGVQPRPDGYPLSWIKRLMVYTEETSPAFLGALLDLDDNIDISLVSTYPAPEIVISNILDEVFGKQQDQRWEEFKNFAGEIAISLVNREDLIESQLLETLGGILHSQ